MQKRDLKFAIICTMCTLLPLQSCVNDDYDLSEDIDATIQVGGNITLPHSSTTQMKMKDVLDLDDDAIVKVLNPDENGDGEYFIVKNPDKQGRFDFELEEISVNKPDDVNFSLNFPMPSKEELLKQCYPELSDEAVTLIADDLSLLASIISDYDPDEEFESDPVELEISYDSWKQSFEIPKEIVALKHISFSNTLRPCATISTTLAKGHLTMYNVIAEYPSFLEHNDNVEYGEWSEKKNDNGNYEFKLPDYKELSKDKGLEITDIEFTGYEDGEWRRDENNSSSLDIQTEVRMWGEVTIKATIEEFFELAGKTFSLDADIKTEEAPVLGDVEVKVDPEIDVETTTVDLTDLPDFLTEEGISIIMQQPIILVDAYYNCELPVTVDCKGSITTDKNADDVQINNIWFGGNDDINQHWCIYDGKRPILEEYDYYQNAENLCNLFKEVPDFVKIEFNANVRDEYYTLELGKSYSAEMKYRMECPLALGAGSQIVYADTIDEWNEDIEEYEIKKAKITAKIYNSTPMDKVDIIVTPIDLDKNEINGIEVVTTPEKNIKNGDNVVITLTCDDSDAMKRLDGVIIKVNARTTVDNSETLRSDSYIQLTDIVVSIEGGIIADLN